jgi:hypothetical protein
LNPSGKANLTQKVRRQASRSAGIEGYTLSENLSEEIKFF